VATIEFCTGAQDSPDSEHRTRPLTLPLRALKS
jgi:hypothetical protein